MYNTFYKLTDNIRNLIYTFDDNENNKKLYNKVVMELNKKRIIEFINYNIFIDNRIICNCKGKISRMYLMDILRTDDLLKYTDYNERLNDWGSYKEIMAESSKYEIARNYKNHNELYKLIINDYLNNNDDEMIYDIIDDFFKWITEHNYYDKRILKNDVFENWENSTDTENETDNETNSDIWDSGTDENETDYDTDESDE